MLSAADLRRGQTVRIHCDNPHLDGQTVRVLRVTEYGALVEWPASASNSWRALFSEIEPVAERPGSATGDICSRCGGANLFRAGACLCCSDCGESQGCS